MTPRALLAPGRLAGRPILRTQSDERLVDLVRAGSEPAFEAIVARYRRPLLRYCSRILSEERAEDAVQQTFVRAYGAMRKNSAELNLKPWLYRIAHNTALNALRDRGLRHEELPDQLDGVEQPDQAIERSQDLRAVVSAVQELPERQRDAIVLRELEGRSYDEIASELGVTDGAVRQLLNRARNTLREAATALTPGWLVARVPPGGGGGEPMAVRVAELCGAGSAGAAAAKVCATALVTGAVVSGGVAMGPDVLPGESARGDRPEARSAERGAGRVAPSAAVPAPVVGAPGAVRGSGSSGSGSSGTNSGQGSGSSGSGSDSSGSGSSGSNSGPGSYSSGSGSGSSGSDYDSSGSGSGYDSSGSGSSDSGSGYTYDSSGSNSGSGSGSSGSGSSGSGSGYSGSGSDSSGSGSSGSGSGDDLDDSSGSGSG
jgi:RNA polymerase sigma factor (sigma-70 family)